jgi:D-alanine transfer protein
MKDPQARPLLVNYLKHIDSKEISHLTFGQMRVFGWHPDLMWDELSFQFANVCTLIKNDWLALLNITPQTVQPGRSSQPPTLPPTGIKSWRMRAS